MVTIDRDETLAQDAPEPGEAEVPPLLSDLAALDGAARRPRPLLARWRRLALGLSFVGGVLLGWLAIGWWLWPTEWRDCGLQDLHPAYQKRFLALVAAEYGRTGDAGQAMADLAGWDGASLSTLLATMENEAPSPQARQQLGALRQALALSDTRPAPRRQGLRADALTWSAALAAVLQLAALAMALVPRLAGESGARREAETEDELLRRLDGTDQAADEPWMQAFADAPAQAEEAPPTGEGSRTGERVKAGPSPEQTAVRQESPLEVVEAEALTDGAEGVLPDLLDVTGVVDPRRETLAQMIGETDIVDVMHLATKVLHQLRQLAEGDGEPVPVDDSRWPPSAPAPEFVAGGGGLPTGAQGGPR